MYNKKVLNIGGAGYIGGLTTDSLIQNSFDVTVYDNLLYEERYMKPVNFIYGDIRDTDKIVKISKDFDTIIVMAALVGDHACDLNPELTEEVNCAAVKNLCEKIPQNKHIIFMSTCSVYGLQDRMIDEASLTHPLSAYARTKLAAEQYVTERKGTVFRLGTVFGLGDTFSRIRMDLVVNVLTMRAVKEGVITINGGSQWRPIISVQDIAGYVTEACKYTYPDIYILAKENVTIKNLGERIAKLISGTKIIYTATALQDERNYRVDNSKSLSAFKFKPMVTVEDEVKKMGMLFKENRIKNPQDHVYYNGTFLEKKMGLNTLLRWNPK